ncbi:MAG: HAD-IIB family hydrolase [Planctomycetaceae bacterium]
MLTEPEQWDEWSASGIRGATEHYSWKRHADRYLRDITDILQHTDRPAILEETRRRRIPNFDRLIITDLDNTLIGDDEALAEFLEVINKAENVGFGIATGRTLQSTLQLIEEMNLPNPDVLSTDCGTQLHYGKDRTPDLSWQKQIGDAWKPDEIRELLDRQPGFFPQPEENQSKYKVSYEIDASVAPKISGIRKILREAGLRANVVLSLEMYLDVIPVRGGSDLSMRHLLWKWGFSPEHVLVAGDSGNDAGMLLGRTLGVVVGNHSRELNRLKKRPRIYFATATHARGILEGMNYYQFLDNIVIPNDRID